METEDVLFAGVRLNADKMLHVIIRCLHTEDGQQRYNHVLNLSDRDADTIAWYCIFNYELEIPYHPTLAEAKESAELLVKNLFSKTLKWVDLEELKRRPRESPDLDDSTVQGA